MTCNVFSVVKLKLRPLAWYMWNVVRCALAVSCEFKNVEECLPVWLKQFTGAKESSC